MLVFCVRLEPVQIAKKVLTIMCFYSILSKQTKILYQYPYNLRMWRNWQTR